MFELANKDLKLPQQKCFSEQIQAHLKQMRNKISARKKNRKYKEEPNGNFKTVNAVAEIKTQWMSSSVECKRQRKESVNWKVEEQKLPNYEQQREKKKIPSQNSLRDLQEYKKRFNTVSLESQKGRKRAELKKVLKEIMDGTFQIWLMMKSCRFEKLSESRRG